MPRIVSPGVSNAKKTAWFACAPECGWTLTKLQPKSAAWRDRSQGSRRRRRTRSRRNIGAPDNPRHTCWSRLSPALPEPRAKRCFRWQSARFATAAASSSCSIAPPPVPDRQQSADLEKPSATLRPGSETETINRPQVGGTRSPRQDVLTRPSPSAARRQRRDRATSVTRMLTVPYLALGCQSPPRNRGLHRPAHGPRSATIASGPASSFALF